MSFCRCCCSRLFVFYSVLTTAVTEYPEVLGSILGALKAIVNVIGMTKMTPPIKDLLPRLTPILKNRHEKVQENVIDLVGRIADRGSEYVFSSPSLSPWLTFPFDLRCSRPTLHLWLCG
jgi:hypothetical protein